MCVAGSDAYMSVGRGDTVLDHDSVDLTANTDDEVVDLTTPVVRPAGGNGGDCG